MSGAQILLVRPGAYRGQGTFLPGRGTTPLSVIGRAQAHALSASLNAARIGAVVHSPSFRAETTARIVAYVHGLPVRAMPALDDMDYGDWTGRALVELDADPRWREWHDDPASACPDGESAAAAAGRLMPALDEIVDATDGVSVVVTHRNLILAALAAITGCGFREAQRFTLAPASITQLRRADGGWEVGGVNLRGGYGLVAPKDRGSWPADREGVGELWAPDGVCRLDV